ncbi:cell wall-binding repeat-containing protein [Paenisporosarcina sp. TG20]|uniref:cell wall-binding repeat-containing protein n=1 Tax=Paenisporosarcina sp. TG20 TaxID=1211706 RepID=UPI0002D5B0CF|nr:cell wall-binding repeat-containing protein [Paenisporosarcina sp. TG20]
MKIRKILGSMILATTLTFVAANSQAEANDDTIRDFTRIEGESRYLTAIQVSKAGWANGSGTVIIASGENFPDALAGAPLAKKLDAPILLVKNSSVDATVLAEIKRLGATKVIILGGTVTTAVETKLKSVSSTVERIKGTTRYETAEEIAKQVGGTKAVVVSGESFPDSLAIASYAAQNGIPILLTEKSKVSFDKTKYSNYTVIGGENAVSNSVMNELSATRIAGADRYATMKAIVNKFYPATVAKPLVASGVSFPDALASSVYAAKLGVPVLLVAKDRLPAETKDIINNKNVDTLKVVGGESAVSKYALGAEKPVVQVVTSPTPTPTPISSGDKLVSVAKQYLGTPYVWGGITPSGFDCSGFMYYVHNKAGIDLSRTNTSGYYNMSTRISSPQPGDLVFFSGTYKAGISHMGIYIGNGSFIHSANGGVQIDKVNDPYYWGKYFTSYNRLK